MHKSYSIKTHKRVDKFFAAHPDIARKAISIFNELAKNPFDSSTNFDIAKYQGRLPNNYRLRI